MDSVVIIQLRKIELFIFTHIQDKFTSRFKVVAGVLLFTKDFALFTICIFECKIKRKILCFKIFWKEVGSSRMALTYFAFHNVL